VSELGPAFVVSDLHLRGPSGENTRAFHRFLDQRVAPSGARLIIVGDLFDWWYARPGFVPPQFAGVVAALEALPSVTWIEGNHDMRIARALRPDTPLDVRARPLHGRHRGRSLELRHGDLLDATDREYLALRGFLRGPFMDAATGLIGARASQRVGELVTAARNRQKGGLGGDHADDGWLRGARGFAAASAAELTVVGHGHWLGWFPEGLICLGDWVHWCSYLELPGDAGPRLRRFVDGADDPILADGAVGALPRLV